MQRKSSSESAAVMLRQQRMTLAKFSQQWMLWSVNKNQLSVTVLLTPPLVFWDMEQSVHYRSHRARKRERLYTLGVTGCSSRAALSGMLKGLAESFARAPLQISPGFLLPDPDRPNIPVCPYGCRGMAVVASFPAVFGPCPKGVWRSEPLDWESASLHLSTPIFLSSLAPPGGARGAGAGRLLLDKVYAFLRAAMMMWRARAGAGRLPAGQGLCLPSRRHMWCARSWSWTAVANTLLDEVHACLPSRKTGAARRQRLRCQAEARSWTAAATTVLAEVYAFLRVARWCARSRSCTAAAITLLDVVYAFLA